MIKSIVFKTTLFVLLALTSVAFAIGWYVYDSQTSIINELQTNQKTYIIQKLARTEKNQIKNELENLKNLSHSIKGALSNALSNADNDAAIHTLTQFLQKSNIQAVTIFDKAEDEMFLVGYRQFNGKILIEQDKLPEKYLKFKFLKFFLVLDDENLGFLKVYYDNSNIIKNIKKLKEEDLNSFNEKAIEINHKINQKLTLQAISAIVGGFIIIMLIVVLLRKFVNKPLIEFKKGLQSFFDYLAVPSRKVEKIDIDTADEFGQMTKSVNESIKVSMKMHGEMAQLMRAMDKNVITSETDDKGIITHVSQAFCEISGYTKEELIGQPHNIVRHPDMPKSAFEDLWNTLKENKTWEGEVKNLKKDGSFYWVHTIITPKCTMAGAACGYTAIRYNITDKKEVEDLTANLEIKIEARTADLDIARKEIEAILKHTRESIEYAALIQSSLVPDNNLFRKYFQEYFVIWHPKDTVGGDIYLFNELRNEDECLIFCIDCTGHGVPGAFVTMLVKAVEAQLMAEIYNNPDMQISTAWVMGYYNNALKKMLKQDQPDCVSNVGWDGSVFYYNKQTKTIKFSGAESPFFYRKPDGEIVTVKGTRKSVGYKQCPMDYEYKETIIENVEEGTKVFLTTDGYLDQNGGPKDFPFGKKKFIQIIEDYGEETMADFQEMFMYEMAEWEEQIEGNDRNDDMTVIGFTI